MMLYIDNTEETHRIASYRFHEDRSIIISKKRNKEYRHHSSRIRIIKTRISEDNANDIFELLTI